MTILTKEQVEALRLSWVGGPDSIYNSHEALRAALTQAEADERLTRETWMQQAGAAVRRAEKAERERDGWEESALQKDGLLLDSLLENARLERTVERMREALEAVKALEQPLCGNPDAHHKRCDCVGHRAHFATLSASSPDHAGAPEGETT